MFAYKDRPILFNSWEGSGMIINEKSLLEMAKLCKEVGIELFVIDDGWFENRNNDHAALGDWVVDKNKFPNGLSPFVNKIKEMGLSFGIWVEPEMISINSDIYRSHPEYALEIPGRTPLERRHQMVIDMSNPDVINYLDDSLSNLFNELKPAYVKWDCNRMISEFYSHAGIRSGELIYRFMMGTYELLERLTKKFPDIIFESCASGGGRYDLGMAYYMPQTWGSDNSNANNRCYIACGTLTGYPQSTFGAHISRDYSVDQKRSAFEDRFNINSIGGFGYEFDIRTSPEKELETMKKQITYFKKHRHLIQFGHYYVIDNCFDDERYYSFNMVSDDQKEAILSAIQTSQTAPKKNWKFKGLNPEYIYEIEMREQDNISLLSFDSKSGKELMENGLDLGLLNEEKDIQDFPNGIQSRMIYIKKVN
jgi:alpha-galactosidase